MSSAFGDRIILHEVPGSPNSPIEKSTRGEHSNWVAKLILYGSSSARLICYGVKKRTHNNDKRDLFVHGIKKLLEDEACESLSFLGHTMRGFIETEEVPVLREQRVEIDELFDLLLDLEEDVPYVISTRVRGWAEAAELTNRIYVDLNGWENRGEGKFWVSMNQGFTSRDLEQSIELQEGVILSLWTDDLDDQNQFDPMFFEGVVHFDAERERWVAIVDWNEIYHASEQT